MKKKILKIKPSSCIDNSRMYTAKIKSDTSLTHVSDMTTRLENIQSNREYNHISIDKKNNISSKLCKSDSEEYDSLNSNSEQSDDLPVKNIFFYT